MTTPQTTTERFDSELRIWAEARARRGWGPAFVPPYQWRDSEPEETRCAGSDVFAPEPYTDGGPAPCALCGEGVAVYNDGPAGYRLRGHLRPTHMEAQS